MKVSANSLHLTVIAIFWLLLVGATVTPVIAQNHYNTVPVPTAFVLGIPGSPATIGPNVNITNEPGRKLKPALLSIPPMRTICSIACMTSTCLPAPVPSFGNLRRRQNLHQFQSEPERFLR